jgi:hypothetical protein
MDDAGGEDLDIWPEVPVVDMRFEASEEIDPEALDVQEDDVQIEESAEFRKSLEIEEPTIAMRAQHDQENHSVYRPWCSICIAARGVGSVHRKSRRDMAQKTKEGPIIYSDFFFMSTDGQSCPHLVMKESRSRRISAVALPKKGGTDFGIKSFQQFILGTGMRRFINHSDGEPSMIA